MTRFNLPKTLLRMFALRRPVDFVLKPLATWAVFLLVYVLWETTLIGWSPAGLDDRLMAVSLTMIPFMAASFILVIYLDRMQSGLVGLAMTDSLTGLPNRRAFIDQVTAYQRHKEPGYLLIIDADHFKRINDTFGHAIGDECLKAIGVRLQSLIANGDAIGRIGGEEFGVYLPYSTQENLMKIGTKLCREILVRHPAQEDLLRFTLSVGATETRPKETVETALARADEALYAAKEAGRARLVLWTKSLSNVA